MHTNADTPPALINRGKNCYADVYFTPQWMHDMSPQLQGPLSELVNQFIYKVQVPVVARRQTIMEDTFGIYHPANTNVLNYDHIPLSLVPDSMVTQGRVASLWCG